MAKILMGGPEGERRDVHDNLVTRLQQEHEVTYVKNDGQSMFWELYKTPLTPEDRRYNLVVYDTGLFYSSASSDKKIELFETGVCTYLAAAKAPILILAETELAESLRSSIRKAGFTQLDLPYTIEAVVHKINEVLVLASNQKP